MQGRVVELIRDLMQAQRMSIRKISAEIAREHGGSALGYTQQINRILNDPDYDPTFSTVQKVLTALNYSLWQTASIADSQILETRLNQMGTDVTELKATVTILCSSVEALTEQLQGRAISSNQENSGLSESLATRSSSTEFD